MNDQAPARKYVYLFREFDEAVAKFDGDWDALRGLLGGKGANLLDATRHLTATGTRYADSWVARAPICSMPRDSASRSHPVSP